MLPVIAGLAAAAAAACSSGAQTIDESQSPVPTREVTHPQRPSPLPTPGERSGTNRFEIFTGSGLGRLPLSGGAVSNVDLDGFTQPLERDAIRPIYRPLVVDAAEADLVADELVLGVQIGGEARAYPVGTLRFREIANDVLGDTPILVTW